MVRRKRQLLCLTVLAVLSIPLVAAFHGRSQAQGFQPPQFKPPPPPQFKMPEMKMPEIKAPVLGWKCLRCGTTGTGPRPFSCPQCSQGINNNPNPPFPNNFAAPNKIARPAPGGNEGSLTWLFIGGGVVLAAVVFGGIVLLIVLNSAPRKKKKKKIRRSLDDDDEKPRRKKRVQADADD